MLNIIFKGGVLIACTMLWAGCSTLPGSGPSKRQMAKDQDDDPQKREYTVVQLDVESIHRLGGPRSVTLNDQFSQSIKGKSGFILGLGLAALMLQQPLIYLALGISWGFSALGQILSLLLDRNLSTANIVALILKFILSACLIASVLGVFG